MFGTICMRGVETAAFVPLGKSKTAKNNANKQGVRLIMAFLLDPLFLFRSLSRYCGALSEAHPFFADLAG